MKKESKFEDTPIGFAKNYGVSLYFGEPCELAITKIIELFEERIGEVSVYDEEDALVSLVFLER